MKSMRTLIAHEYGAVDYDIVWNSLANDLPREAARVRAIHVAEDRVGRTVREVNEVSRFGW